MADCVPETEPVTETEVVTVEDSVADGVVLCVTDAVKQPVRDVVTEMDGDEELLREALAVLQPVGVEVREKVAVEQALVDALGL